MYSDYLFCIYSRMNHNLEMVICLCQLEKENTVTRSGCLPFSILKIALAYFFLLWNFLLFQKLRAPVFFIIYHSSRCFVIHLLKQRFYIFLPGYGWKRSVKQHRARTDFHTVSLEIHPHGDESKLPMEFGDPPVSQLLMHYMYVLLIVCHFIF